MPDSFDYTTGTNSENVRLLQALIDDAPEYTEETNSRNANILKSIINNTEYTDAPQSEIEELLLELKEKIAGGGGDITVESLNVTENGTYTAPTGKAYSPVKVELPLSSKTITENGTYTASDDNLAGFNEVTVAVEGYAKKSIANTPTDIATFNASALPMPSLTVGIEATQDLHGYDYPWVGGAGKNKFNADYFGSTTTYFNRVDTTFTNKSTDSRNDFRLLVQAFNGNTFIAESNQEVITSAGRYSVTINISSTPTFIRIKHNGSSSDLTLDYPFTQSGQYTISLTVVKTNPSTIGGLEFKDIQLEQGSSATTSAPYSNICPIVGKSAVNRYRCGKNLFNLINGAYTPTNRTITINNQTIHYVNNGAVGLNYILRGSLNAWKIPKLSAGKTYSFKYTENGNIGFTNVQLEIIHDDGTTTNINSGSSATLSKDGKVSDLKCDFISTTSNTEADITLQLEEGTTATTYEPYNGTTYTTQLKDGQGNPMVCYGGELVNENGVQTLVDGYDCFELYEDWNWIASSTYSGAFYVTDNNTSHSLKPDTPVLCTHAKNVNDLSDYVYGTILHNMAINIRIMPENSTVQDFKNYIVEQRQNGTPIKVRVQRETPTEIPQDNLAIASQDGINNIWADTGDVIEGEYFSKL